MQSVYISNRPDILNETIVHVGWFMPFITEAVVACPRSVAPLLVEPSHGPTIRPVADEEILPEYSPGRPHGLSRTQKNYALRARLVGSSVVESEFVMSDDDYRPLKTMSKDIFVSGGRYKAYYFYDLDQWHSAETDFDSVQHNVAGALD